MIKRLIYKVMFAFKPPRVGVIATLTRSGTWYCRCFFFALHKLLAGDEFDSTELVREFYAEDREFKDVKNTLGLDKLIIAHATCPGFKDHYRGELRESWDKLEFYGEGHVHDNGDIIMQKSKRKKIFDPYYNHNSKIVYIYRNPLDSAVSFMKALENYKNPRVMYKKDSDGNKAPFEDVKDYIYSAGLPAFIKQFFTFKAMREMFPKNIIMVPYEDLIKKPEQTFMMMLAHFGYVLKNDHQLKMIRRALYLSSQDSLKVAEQNLGFNLANDRAMSGDTQIRGGAVGKWKAFFDEIDIERIEIKMNAFNLSLKDCILE